MQSSIHDPGWNEWLGRLTAGELVAGLIGFVIGLVFILLMVHCFSDAAWLRRAIKRQLKHDRRFSKDNSRELPEGEDYEVQESRRVSDPRMRL